MISTYQKPQISFKAFSCNFGGFSTVQQKNHKQTKTPYNQTKTQTSKQTKTKKTHTTLLKPEHRQD